MGAYCGWSGNRTTRVRGNHSKRNGFLFAFDNQLNTDLCVLFKCIVRILFIETTNKMDTRLLVLHNDTKGIRRAKKKTNNAHRLASLIRLCNLWMKQVTIKNSTAKGLYYRFLPLSFLFVYSFGSVSWWMSKSKVFLTKKSQPFWRMSLLKPQTWLFFHVDVFLFRLNDFHAQKQKNRN